MSALWFLAGMVVGIILLALIAILAMVLLIRAAEDHPDIPEAHG